MPRNKLIDTETLLKMIDKYMIDMNVDHISIPDFGRYLRSNGYPDVQDYIIRRDNGLRDYINTINTAASDDALITVATYITLDTKRFIEENNSIEKLMAALSERDNYYRRVAASAGILNKQALASREKVKSLEAKASELQSELQLAQQQISQLKDIANQMKTLQNENKALRKIIEDVVYPSAATALLNDAGISTTGEIVDQDKIDQLTIHADSNIYDVIKHKTVENDNNNYAYRNSVVSDLWKGLNSDVHEKNK